MAIGKFTTSPIATSAYARTVLPQFVVRCRCALGVPRPVLWGPQKLAGAVVIAAARPGQLFILPLQASFNGSGFILMIRSAVAYLTRHTGVYP